MRALFLIESHIYKKNVDQLLSIRHISTRYFRWLLSCRNILTVKSDNKVIELNSWGRKCGYRIKMVQPLSAVLPSFCLLVTPLLLPALASGIICSIRWRVTLGISKTATISKHKCCQYVGVTRIMCSIYYSLTLGVPKKS